MIYKKYFSSGRYACIVGLNNFNIVENDKILVPNYICSSLIDKLEEYNFKIIYYKIKSNFQPNWKFLKKIDKNNLKAIIMVNYFGQPQNIKRFRKFCKKHKLLLIEDNSHGYGNHHNGKLLGTLGDFGFSSLPKKIDNLISGGILYSTKKINVNNYIKKNYMPSIPEIIKYLLKDLNLFKKLYKIFSTKRNYLDENLNFDKKISDGLIDSISLKKLLRSNINQINKNYLINYYKYKNLYKKFFPKIFFQKNISIPWKLVINTKNKKTTKEILDWSYKNRISISTWPSLPKSVVLKYPSILSFWRKILVVSLRSSC